MKNIVQRKRNLKKIFTYLFTFLLVLGLTSFGVFAAEDAASEDQWLIISIVFIIIDVIELITIIILINIYKKVNKKLHVHLKLQDNLNSISIGAVLAFSRGWFVLLLLVAIFMFFTISELSFLIYDTKEKLKKAKSESLEHQKKLQEDIQNGSISYIMSDEDWYNLEKNTCENLVSRNDSPILYIIKEIEKEEGCATPDEQRLVALKKLYQEYLIVPDPVTPQTSSIN